jgi:hypothetical protein
MRSLQRVHARGPTRDKYRGVGAAQLLQVSGHAGVCLVVRIRQSRLCLIGSRHLPQNLSDNCMGT